MKTLLAALTLTLALPAHAAMFKYNELVTKDYDEMSQMVQTLLGKARAVGSNSSDTSVDDAQALEHLREAMKLIFSRPNSDNMIAKLTPEVRRELIGYNGFEKTLQSLTVEALGVVKNEKAAISQQATALFMLENLLSEIRPEVPNSPGLKKLVENVKAADIEVSEDVRKDIKLRGMFKIRNPSELAAEILKSLPPPKKADPKKVKKAKDEE